MLKLAAEVTGQDLADIIAGIKEIEKEMENEYLQGDRSGSLHGDNKSYDFEIAERTVEV